MSSPERPLVLAAHGTDSPRGQAVLAGLLDRVRALLPTVQARLAYVDVIEPSLPQALAGTTGAVVVPLFLAAGYHVNVDVPAAVAVADAAIASEQVGSHVGVLDALVDRIGEVTDRRRGRAGPQDGVVLAAAGSSDERAREQVLALGTRLEGRLGHPVAVGFLGGPGTTVPEALASLVARTSVPPPGPGAAGSPVVVASYLLAPGFFQTRLETIAGDLALVASAPLGAHDRIVQAVVERYRSTVTTSPLRRPDAPAAHPRAVAS